MADTKYVALFSQCSKPLACLVPVSLCPLLRFEISLIGPADHTGTFRLHAIVTMSRPSRRCIAGLVQMTSINDTAANFATCKKLTQEAVRKGCQIVFFPECFSFIGAQAGEAQAVAEPLDGPTMGWYKQLARDESVWLSLGGYQEKGPEGDSRIYNTHVIINSAGSLISAYRKIHLFDVPMVGLVESKQAIAGRELLSCDSPVGKLGLAICYDMRFPEMHQKLTFSHGAEVLTFPSAFAMKTGEAHWETLLRCRAIECQTYVVAAAQVGQHNEHGNKRQSWGHAMAVDPWGKVVAQFGGAGDVGVKPFEIDLDLVQKTRDNMPMHTHRRYDLYTDQPVAGSQSLFSALPHLAFAAAVPIGLFVVASAARALRARAA